LSRHRKDYPLAAETVPWLAGLVMAQFMFGAGVIWTGRTPIVTSLHVMTGAALLALATLLALRAWPGRQTAKTTTSSQSAAAPSGGALASR
jgi:heme A synthase